MKSTAESAQLSTMDAYQSRLVVVGLYREPDGRQFIIKEDVGSDDAYPMLCAR